MMGRQDKQLKMILLDLSSMVPENHLLRIIKEHIDFDFIYDHVRDRYSTIGRPSIDPVLLIKMLLVGYLYGIKSERRLEEELNSILLIDGSAIWILINASRIIPLLVKTAAVAFKMANSLKIYGWGSSSKSFSSTF